MGAKGVQPRDIARKFPRAVQKALEETVNKLEDQFKKEIKSSTWQWYSLGGAKKTLRKEMKEIILKLSDEEKEKNVILSEPLIDSKISAIVKKSDMIA